jgi:hypothetical protein
MSKRRLLRIAKWFTGIILGLVLLITILLYVFKDDICGLVIDEVNKQLKAKVSVSDVDLAFWGSFPSLSVDFKDVFIQDSFEGSTELDTLVYSKRIRLKFNPMDIWQENYTLKTIEVSPGTLKLKVDDEGKNNFDIFAEKSDTLESTGFELRLEEVEFEDFYFSYVNRAVDQEYVTKINYMSLVGDFNTSVFTATATSDLHIIAARSGKINLVSDKPARLDVRVNVDKQTSTVDIPQSTIYISELPFDFIGNVKNDGFQFRIKGKNISIADAANKLAMKESENVKQFSGSGLLLFDLFINGTNDAVQPVDVDCSFGIKNGYLKEPVSGIEIRNVHVDGAYSNKGGAEKERHKVKLTVSEFKIEPALPAEKAAVKWTYFAPGQKPDKNKVIATGEETTRKLKKEGSLMYEAFMSSPEGGEKPTTKRVDAVMPKIKKAYWADSEGNKIARSGYGHTVYLHIETLGLTGEKFQFNVWESDTLSGSDPIKNAGTPIEITTFEGVINQEFKLPEYSMLDEREQEFYFTIEKLDFELLGTKQDEDSNNEFLLLKDGSGSNVDYLKVTPDKKITSLRIYEGGGKLHTGRVKFGDTVTIKITSRNRIDEEIVFEIWKDALINNYKGGGNDSDDIKFSETIKIKVDKEGKGSTDFTIPAGWERYQGDAETQFFYLKEGNDEYPKANFA